MGLFRGPGGPVTVQGELLESGPLHVPPLHCHPDGSVMTGRGLPQDVDVLLAPLEDAAGELAHELGVQGVGLCGAAARNSAHVVPDI